MEWAALSMIIVSVLIGCQAQGTKGRWGKAWGLLTFVVLVILQLAFSPDGSSHRIPEEETPILTLEGLSRIIAIAIGGPLMSWIVWRLPKIHRPER